MQKLNAQQFKAHIRKDPSWASKLAGPVEITTFCDMRGFPITHLSPLLHFTGPNAAGHVARFDHCAHLKVAEGNFARVVSFIGSGIKTIGALKIDYPNANGIAASFIECENLEIATGTFPGHVDFNSSGIRKIRELVITQPSEDGEAANFFACKNLEVAEGTYPGFVDFCGSGIKKIGKLIITATNRTGEKADFHSCEVRLPAEFLGPEYDMTDNFRRKNLCRIAAAKSQASRLAIEI